MAAPVDPYRVLGLARSATTDEVRRAFRAAAKECHPDLYPDDPVRAERFKQISWAHALLTDPEARRKHDAMAEQARARYAGSRPEAPPRPTGAPKAEAKAERRFRFPGIDGANVEYSLEITAAEARAGTRTTLKTTDGRTLRVTVPPNARDGDVLRLRGQGMPGKFGGAPGDALVTVRLALPPELRAAEEGVHCDLDVPLEVAVLGGKLQVPTIDGGVAITIPPGSNSGDTLRLRGKGRAGADGTRGDQYVHLRIMLPRPPDRELERLLRTWAEGRIGAS
jgi:DnaJ-class molecular chaperone